MQYRLDCPHCDHVFAVTTAKAGGTLSCPQCDQPVVVPKLGRLRELPTVDDDEAANAAKSTSKKNRDVGTASTDSPLPMIVLGFVFTGSLLIAGYCGLRWALTEVALTTEEHLAEYEQSYGEVAPALLIREYETMEQYGLELPGPANYIKQATIRRQWGTSAAIAAAVSTLCLIGTVWLARRRGSS